MPKPRITDPVVLKAYAELELKDILKDFDEFYVKTATNVRGKIQQEMRTSLLPYKQYLEQYLKLSSKKQQQLLKKQFRTFFKNMGATLDPSKPVDANFEVGLNRVMGAFNEMIPAANRINKKVTKTVGGKPVTLKSGDQQAHKDFSNIGAQSFIIYTQLNKLKGLKKKLSVNTVDKEGTSIAYSAQGPELVKLTEYFRRLWITATALARMPQSMFTGNAFVDIEKALDRYFKTTTQVEHIGIKQKQVDVITGKALQKIVIEEQGDQSKAEQQLGFSKKARITGQAQNKQIQKLLQDTRFTRLKGSHPLEGEVVKQLTDVAAGKKPKKYTSKNKQKQKTKLKNKGKQITAQLKPLIIAAAASGQFTKLEKVKIGKKRQSEKGSLDQRRINKLKMKINQRLPAEVRRNMGRPALRNQTGRFSNSVTLTELRQGPKTLIGKYAYMFAPYETFENEGERRWPTGYNPKPLITKSIRNLALQYTDEKFTLRRE